MKNYLGVLFISFIFLFTLETNVKANDVYFIDYSKVMNESKAGKKAQD